MSVYTDKEVEMEKSNIPIEQLGIDIDVYHGRDGGVAVEVNGNIFGSYEEALNELRRILDAKVTEIHEKYGEGKE